MRISDEDLEAMEPVQATCSETELIVTLANGQKIVTPLWWYPRLLEATPEQREKWQITPFGDALHWQEIDEDLDVHGFLIGARAPDAKAPVEA